MDLAGLISKLEEALKKKDDLADATKENNARIKDLKEAIGDELVEQNKTETMEGDYKYSLEFKRDWSFKSEKMLETLGVFDKFELLESVGMEEFITRSVNTRGLSAEINERLERKEPIPEDLEDALTVWEHNDIGRKKLTAKQKRLRDEAAASLAARKGGK